MNIKIVAIALAAAAIIGGGIWWLTAGNDNDSAANSGQDSSEVDQASSINELLAQNQNLMCTFSDTDEQGNASSGTVYLAGGRMSGDFSLRAPGEDSIASHILSDGQYQYSWQEGEDEGVKISFEQIDTQPGGDNQDQETATNVNQEQDYNFQCQEWKVDESRFSPPSDVNFIDYSQVLEDAQQSQEQNSQALEEACAQISDPESRAACEASL